MSAPPPPRLHSHQNRRDHLSVRVDNLLIKSAAQAHLSAAPGLLCHLFLLDNEHAHEKHPIARQFEILTGVVDIPHFDGDYFAPLQICSEQIKAANWAVKGENSCKSYRLGTLGVGDGGGGV